MRHIVWACFGVDANSPEQGRRIVNRIVEPYNAYLMGVYGKARVNAVVFVNPEFDKLIREPVKKAKGE